MRVLYQFQSLFKFKDICLRSENFSSRIITPHEDSAILKYLFRYFSENINYIRVIIVLEVTAQRIVVTKKSHENVNFPKR